MYKITAKDNFSSERLLFVPSHPDYTLSKAVLSLKVGSAGEFEFTVPITSPAYRYIWQGSIITIYRDGHEFWRGDIRDIKTRFDKSLDVYALEDFAWLGEEPVEPGEKANGNNYVHYINLMDKYNQAREDDRKFRYGSITAADDTYSRTWRIEYETSVLDAMRTYLANDGVVRIRRQTYTGGTVYRFVDVINLSDYGVQASQKIEFGSNLLDFVKEIDITNIVNVLYPFGAETEEILYGDVKKRLVGDVVTNNTSIADFGRRARSVIFDTEDLATLRRLAQAYVTRYSQPGLKIEVKAVDLGTIDVNIDKFNLGDSVHIIANTFNVDRWVYITDQVINLLDIARNQITLSDNIR